MTMEKDAQHGEDGAQNTGGYVYMIEAEKGVIKVGISTDPERRLRELRTASSADLSMVKKAKFDNPSRIESKIHNDLSEYRKRGEWFDLGVNMRDKLAERLPHIEVGDRNIFKSTSRLTRAEERRLEEKAQQDDKLGKVIQAFLETGD